MYLRVGEMLTWVLAARTPEYAAREMEGLVEARRRDPPIRSEVAIMQRNAKESELGIQSRVSEEDWTEAKESVSGQQARKNDGCPGFFAGLRIFWDSSLQL
jgi:hypothetical protein